MVFKIAEEFLSEGFPKKVQTAGLYLDVMTTSKLWFTVVHHDVYIWDAQLIMVSLGATNQDSKLNLF